MALLLTVFGATGQQGGNLIEYILTHPTLVKTFKLRAVTRDVTKPAALLLQEKGVEVVKADMDDPTSLVPAVSGSYAVFAMTNYWEKISAASEIAQGKAVADAAVTAGVHLLIWSSLPHISRMTGGRNTHVKHFDSKADVEQYIRGLPIQSAFFMPGWFMQNFLVILKPKPNGDGTYTLSSNWGPEFEIPLIDIRDTGKFIAPALLSPDKYNGKNLIAATAFYTPQEIVDTWTKVTGKKVNFVRSGDGILTSTLSEEAKRELKKSESSSEFQYYGPAGKEDLEWTLDQLTESLTSWEKFVGDHEPWFEST